MQKTEAVLQYLSLTTKDIAIMKFMTHGVAVKLTPAREHGYNNVLMVEIIASVKLKKNARG